MIASLFQVRQIMQMAIKLMPSTRQGWSDAMSAELDALPQGKEQVRFALGCLTSAIYEQSKTRAALTRIGQIAIGMSLMLMAAYGLYWSQTGLDPILGRFIFVLFLGYGALGLISLFSLRGLQHAAFLGILLAGTGLLYAMSGGDTFAGLPSAYLGALSLEAGILMIGLVLATCYLKLLSAGEDGLHDSV